MVRITPRRRVVSQVSLALPLPAQTVWGQLRDFRSYACHDTFHSAIQIAGGVPRAGAALRIEHRFLLFRTVRVGRICFWREGVGYAFSDLSPLGVRRGFPHVLSFRICSTGAATCTLNIRVTGRWTAPGPRWLARLWVGWVMAHIRRTTHNRLLAFALLRRMRARPGEGPPGRVERPHIADPCSSAMNCEHPSNPGVTTPSTTCSRPSLPPGQTR